MGFQGFRTPDPDDIRGMFARISHVYDRFNSIHSLGMHHRWRRELVKFSEAGAGSRILDCATGTGDVAFAFERMLHDPQTIVGVDFCPEMLEEAEKKKQARASRIRFLPADVLNLPFADRTFDVVSIAFGARNIPDLSAALREMARVVRPSGRVMVLESGRPKNPALLRISNLYYRFFVAGVSGWMTGHRRDYRYLDESTAHFESGDRFLKTCRETGCFKNAEAWPLSFGFIYLYRLTVA